MRTLDEPSTFAERVAKKDTAGANVIATLGAHRFDEVQARLSGSLRRRLSPADLASLWGFLEENCGAFVREETVVAADRSGDVELERITPTSLICHFEHGSVKALIDVRPDGVIEYLRFVVPAPPRRPCAPDDAEVSNSAR